VTIDAVVVPGGADVGREAPREADVAQAHLFAAALHAEVAELQLRIEQAQRRLRQRGKRSRDLDPPERLLQLRADLEEATRIMNALRDSRLLRPGG
jgi:hypothetical protein